MNSIDNNFLSFSKNSLGNDEIISSENSVNYDYNSDFSKISDPKYIVNY